MKRILFLIIISILSIALCSCAKASGGDYAPGYDGIVNSELTTENLNNLRGVVGYNWGYAFVAGDCIFNEDGYYKFEDVLEYTLSQDGVRLGEESQRAVYFARGENSVYGVYRTSFVGGEGTFYSFSASYSNPKVKYSYLGKFGYEDAFVGQEGEEDCRYILIGNALIVYDFTSMTMLKEQNVGANLLYDFTYFQKGNTSIIFDKEGFTNIYTFNKDRMTFTKVFVEGDLSSASNPTIIDGVYVFGGTERTFVSLNETQFDKAIIDEKYTNWIAEKTSATVTDGNYSIVNNKDTAIVTVLQTEQSVTLTVNQMVGEVSELKACVEKRDNTLPEIVSVKIIDGEIYIILEKEPDTFAGFRDVNDGIPPIIIRYDFALETFEFCGLVDFTGYNVYRIIKL